ncbi:Magnesium transporter NIPA [Cryptosporidium felis]|nr:Magnesium transporter NIPA [Cryptosporidium felis]
MWYFGVVTALLSSVFGGLGDNLIRLSFTLEEEMNISDRRPVILRPIWLLGVFFSCILNAVLIIISLNFASAMIVTPFSGLHIFWSIIFSKYILNEEIKPRHYKGTFLVIVGLLFIILFGLKDVPVFTVPELTLLYTKPKFVSFCFVNISFILICIYVTLFGVDEADIAKYHNNISESEPNDKLNQEIIVNRNNLHLKLSNVKDFISKYRYGITELNKGNDMEGYQQDFSNFESSNYANKKSNEVEDSIENDTEVELSYGFGSHHNSDPNLLKHSRIVRYIYFVESRIGSIKHKLKILTKGAPRIKVSTPIKRFCMCSTSGLSGGYTNVLVQNLIQTVVLDGVYVLLHRLTYQLLVIIFITGSIQWLFWNNALSKYQAIFVVPIVNSVLIASSGFCNLMLYYDEQYNSNSLWTFLVQFNFLLGQFLIVFGIYIISRANRTPQIGNPISSQGNLENKSIRSKHSFDQAFEFDESLQTDFISNKHFFSFQSKMAQFSKISDFFKAKKEKLSSSLESLLNLYRNQNLNSNNICNDSDFSKSSTKPHIGEFNGSNSVYSNNLAENHIQIDVNNTIILPQEVDEETFEERNSLVEDITQTSEHEHGFYQMNSDDYHNFTDAYPVENSYTNNYSNVGSLAGNAFITGNEGYPNNITEGAFIRNEASTIGGVLNGPPGTFTSLLEFSGNEGEFHELDKHEIQRQVTKDRSDYYDYNCFGGEYGTGNEIELESYVLDEYDIDDLEINCPVAEQIVNEGSCKVIRESNVNEEDDYSSFSKCSTNSTAFNSLSGNLA